ncbi:MAG: hypothetical protein RSA49_01375 [Anaerovoracaceae bacterium]
MNFKKTIGLVVLEYLLIAAGVAIALLSKSMGITILGLFVVALSFPVEVFKLKEGGELKGKEVLVQYGPLAIFFITFLLDRFEMIEDGMIISLVVIAGVLAILGESFIRANKLK